MIVSPGSRSDRELGDAAVGDRARGDHHPHHAGRRQRCDELGGRRRARHPLVGERTDGVGAERRCPTQRCPSRIARRTRFAPMRPSPTIPSCIGVSVAIAPSRVRPSRVIRVYESGGATRPPPATMTEPLSTAPPGRRSARTTRRSADLHLRDLFAADRDARRAPLLRGGRDPRRPLEAPRHGGDGRLLLALAAERESRPSAATRCTAASTSTRPRIGRRSTSRCGCRATGRSSSTA